MGAFLEAVLGVCLVAAVLCFSAALIIGSETVVSYIKRLYKKPPNTT